MSEQELRERLEQLEKKIDATFQSAEKTRKYFLAVIVISVIAFVLPLVGLIFAVPTFLGSYADFMGGL